MKKVIYSCIVRRIHERKDEKMFIYFSISRTPNSHYLILIHEKRQDNLQKNLNLIKTTQKI